MQVSLRSGPLVWLVSLGVASFACARSLPPAPSASPPPQFTPTALVSPTAEDSDEAARDVVVTASSSYVDSFNYFHLVGEIKNHGDLPVTGIELMAHIADARGEPAKDGDDRPIDGAIFSPLLYTLAPGESAPFDFFRLLPDGADIGGWQTSVTVVSAVAAELQRAVVEVKYNRLALHESGTIYLTGKLTNPGSRPVTINSFAGALLSPGGGIMAANTTTDFAGYLAAAGDPAGGDSTPFVIGIDGPADTTGQAAYYVDAELAEPQPAADDIDVMITDRFADEFDDLHVAANVTNRGAHVLTIRLVAGLYAADGTVLDAASATAPIYAAPGATVPVTFDYFNSLNRSADDQALVERVTVQIDPLWTYAIPYPVVTLQTANEVKEQVGTAQYSFRGEVVNNSEVPVTSATLILAIYDGADNLVTSSWTIVYPETETFQPGATLPFDMSVYLPTDVDVSDFTFTTIVQGYVKD